MKEDRFLVAILVVIALLVAVALGTFFLQRENAVYLPEDTPDGVVHNYILALAQEDYERAYNYLADEEYKPDYETFVSYFLTYRGGDAGYQIGEVREVSDTMAYVELTVMDGGGAPFGERYSYAEQARLVKEEGEWKIIEMPYAFWDWAWYQEE